ncbi:tRNA (adenosine(37)-N6)-dimethylallyltransferase MiaA [Leptospira bouyouniensis]|uniref:tRNA dimethylallyltransferase n=1 Tax=Leptospira bouyouniensis TaxID=2484911 RepID=A0ABY2L3D1_9LEPT|nr:tRNA (adenosine(37)-N6)-dimethylallyltransferase MiaA [Leptospira bouyouniensis]TGK46433.1 tRNA (adenosine(37)-N6)-dimethylallyltransferase MiaA [Leptospira bouyouniensis]TGM79537.1 tRNA (adenosine(37)-N6)-dimethylallyltransferase MiaA [Leptospira bouyouniensis]
MILPILGGPTGSGKTSLTQSLDPKRFEIVSFDSRQVYRDLPVGTTAPTPEESSTIKHWLIGFLNANETINANQFSLMARDAISDIQSRGKIPFLIGGTGFYLRAFLLGMFPVPNVPKETKEYVLGLPLDEARLMLQQKDPKAMETLSYQDGYRIKRALEVVLTGVLWSDVSKETVGGFLKDNPDIKLVGHWLDWPREILYNRINTRVEQIVGGMIEETKEVVSKYGPDCPGLRTLGYNFALAFLNGMIDINTFIEQLAQSHRNYAKRQITWFKKEPFLSPISYDAAVQLYTNIEQR